MPWGPGVVIKHPMIPAIYHPATSQSSQNCSRLNSWFLKTNFTWPYLQDFYKRGPAHNNVMCNQSWILFVWYALIWFQSLVELFLAISFSTSLSRANICKQNDVQLPASYVWFTSPFHPTSSPNFFSANLRDTESILLAIGVANQSTWVGRTSKINPVR